MNKQFLIERLNSIVKKRIGPDIAANLWCSEWTFDNYIAHIATTDEEPKVVFDDTTLFVLIGASEFYPDGIIQIEGDIGINEHTINLLQI